MDPEATLKAEQDKLAAIEGEMHAVQNEREALRQKAKEVKARYVAQAQVVTQAIQARPDRNAQGVQ